MGKTKISDLRATIAHLKKARTALVEELARERADHAVCVAQRDALRQHVVDLRGHLETLKSIAPESSDAEPGAAAIHLMSHGPGRGKIDAIKMVRSMCVGMGLKDAKVLVESAPCRVGQLMDRSEADKWADDFRSIGATVEVRGVR